MQFLTPLLGQMRRAGFVMDLPDPSCIVGAPGIGWLHEIGSFAGNPACSDSSICGWDHWGALIDGQRARRSQNPSADLSEDISRGTICSDVNGLPAVLNRKSSGCDSGLCATARSVDHPYLPRPR